MISKIFLTGICLLSMHLSFSVSHSSGERDDREHNSAAGQLMRASNEMLVAIQRLGFIERRLMQGNLNPRELATLTAFRQLIREQAVTFLRRVAQLVTLVLPANMRESVTEEIVQPLRNAVNSLNFTISSSTVSTSSITVPVTTTGTSPTTDASTSSDVTTGTSPSSDVTTGTSTSSDVTTGTSTSSSDATTVANTAQADTTTPAVDTTTLVVNVTETANETDTTTIL